MTKKTETILHEILKALRVQNAEFKAKDLEIEKDDSIQDDTEYMNDFHNQAGYIDGLEFCINIIRRLDKKKKV